MLNGYEKFVFDFNDAAHSIGIISKGSYIDGLSLFLFIATDILATILIYKYIQTKKEHIDKYIPAVTIFLSMAVLILLEAYIEIIILFLLVGFYLIIVKNDKYINIREMIDKLF